MIYLHQTLKQLHSGMLFLYHCSIQKRIFELSIPFHQLFSQESCVLDILEQRYMDAVARKMRELDDRSGCHVDDLVVELMK